MIYVREFFHYNGIEWIKCINVAAFDIVDLDSAESNRSALRLIRRNAILIELKALFSYDENRLSFEKRFPDEDFCLYQEFPFRQLIVLTDDSFLSVVTNKTTKVTCTFMWLAKYYPTHYPILNVYWYFDYEFPVDFIKAKLVECNFTERLQRCNRSDFHVISTDLAQSELEAKMRISWLFF